MRRPPLLGATGIDFGSKPAISFVLPPKKVPRPVEDVDSSICPPSGSPTHMEASFSVDGTVPACADHAADIDFSASGTIDGDLAPYSGTDSCCSTSIASGATEFLVDATCPAECGIPTADSYVDFQVQLCWDAVEGTWRLGIIGQLGIICGNGDAGFLQDLTVDLGSGDPRATHHIEQASNNGNANWIIDVTIL